MDKRLKEIVDDVHHRTLQQRSIQAIVKTPQFERLWEESTQEERDKVDLYIQFGYKSKVGEWIKNHSSLELGERSLKYLKDRAMFLFIKNYSRLSKAELISAIVQQEEINSNEAN